MQKVALVTGSSRGIGKHIALKLAHNNYTVVITGRQPADVTETVQEITRAGGRAYGLTADLCTQKGLDASYAFVQETLGGRLDLLVCNIGKGGAINNLHTPIEEWKNVFEINFFSTVMAFNTFLNLLIQSKGHIICISSIAGIEKLFLPSTYGVAKAAVISFVKQMMRPLAEKSVRINAISPGMVWVENGSWQKKMQTQPDWVNSILNEQVPFKKFVAVDEIAESVLFLEQTKSLTGQNIVIDAGHTRQA